MSKYILITDRTGRIFRIMDKEKISYKEAEKLLIQKEQDENYNILDDIDLIEVMI